MFRALILIFFVAVVSSFSASAQTRAGVEDILSVARQRFAKGEECFKSGNMECARREFDQAIDYIFDQGMDVRSDERLRLGLRELIEKINRYETAPASENAKGFWRPQEFDGRPADDRTEATTADQDDIR